MAGPGGTEVGRVSVRVVPDTDNFRKDVEKELKELQTLEAEIPITLDLEKFKAQIEEVKVQLKSIQDETVNVNVDKNGDKIGDFGKEVAAATREVEKLGKATKKAFKDGESGANGFRRTLSRVGQNIKQVGSQSASLAATIASGLAQSFASVGSTVASAGAQLLLWIPLLAAAAAGITFLVGAVAALIGGLPVLIAGLAGPIAAIVLGLDGIKNAAKSISPEFNKLKTTVSSVFQKGLTPVFKELKSLMPTLTSGLSGVATSLTQFVKALVDTATTSENIQNLKNAFKGMSTFIGDLTGGVQALFQAFLNVIGTTDLFGTLGRMIEDIASQFANFLNEINNNGSLGDGLKNLGLVVSSLTNLFFHLLAGALNFFNGASPGIKTLVDAITGFIDRIDWQGLGQKVGDAAAKFGDFLDKLDSQTIADFVDAFGNLATAVADLATGESGKLLLNLFLWLLQAIDGLIEGFSRLVKFLKDVAGGIGDFFGSFSSIGEQGMGGLLSGLQGGGSGVMSWLGGFLSTFGGMFGILPNELSDSGSKAMGGLQQGIQGGGGGAVGAAGDVKDGVSNVFTDSSTLLDPNGQQMINGLVNGIRSTMRFIAIALTGIKAAVTGAFAGAGGWLVGAGATIVSGLAVGIRSQFAVIRATLAALTSLIPSWKGPYSVDRKLLTPNGAVIMQSLVDGLNSGYGDVQKTLGGMTTDIAGAFGSSAFLNDVQASGADISAVGQAQLAVAGNIAPDGVATAVADALSNWNIVMDPTGVARLVKKGNQNLDRRR
jgi:hypothetical protein